MFMLVFLCTSANGKASMIWRCVFARWSDQISPLELAGYSSGLGGAEVACWPLITKFAGSNPGRSRRIFLRKGSKIIGPT